MAPPLDAYMIRMKNLHNRYSLPSSAMTLFGALGEQQRGYDPDALGRLMRMSPGMRKACTDTISQLAMVMQRNQDSSTIAECTELIKCCTEMLALASKFQLKFTRNIPSQSQQVYIPLTCFFAHLASLITSAGAFTPFYPSANIIQASFLD